MTTEGRAIDIKCFTPETGAGVEGASDLMAAADFTCAAGRGPAGVAGRKLDVIRKAPARRLDAII
jgi:hypothetical protein